MTSGKRLIMLAVYSGLSPSVYLEKKLSRVVSLQDTAPTDNMAQVNWADRLARLPGLTDDEKGYIFADRLKNQREGRNPQEHFSLPVDISVAAALKRAFLPALAPEGPNVASEYIQRFVRSAGNNFSAYKHQEAKFLTVHGDLLGSYADGCLIWIRKCYIDLMDILDGIQECGRFIFRGTAGVGKSLFMLVWLSSLARQRKKVIFKNASEFFFLLDFGEEKAFGPYSQDHPDLQDVLYDRTAWLILDGQATSLTYPCRMLLACSNKEDNYHKFAKHKMCKSRFIPVWAQQEVENFWRILNLIGLGRRI